MNIDFFIARRLLKGSPKGFSRPIIVIAVLSIMLGSAVMLISLGVLQGFQAGIKEKIVGFGSHLRVMPFATEGLSVEEPLSLDDTAQWHAVSQIPEVKHCQGYAVKVGVVKTDMAFEGILLKGVGADFDRRFLLEHWEAGEWLSQPAERAANEVVVSQMLCRRLQLQLGDKFRMYFYVDSTYRARVFTITGIYNTGLEMYDHKMVYCDLAHLQKLNGWASHEVGGVEIQLHDLSQLPAAANSIYAQIANNQTIATIRDIEPSLFSWLDLLDTNVVVILLIMALVSIVTIISTLLIMIFERTATIGVLKTLGSQTTFIVRIFLWQSSLIIGLGLLFGNLLAGLFYGIQTTWHLFKLDAQSYYLDSVPFLLHGWQVLLINGGVLVLCLLSLLLPARVIGTIRPIKALKFD